DELHHSTAGIFDVLHAASKQTGDGRIEVPRPFDIRRDGLVVGEGAAAVVLESYPHARNRGARILGEVTGYHTCCDGGHMTSPSSEGMYRCMKGALDQAGLNADEIDYINAHATGTKLGDIAESGAIRKLFRDRVPVSATKGFTGHTLAASGVMETIFCLLMMAHNVIIPTLHLETIDPECDGILHVQEKTKASVKRVMTSNFAFGGINAALVLQKLTGNIL
ncbi:MAG: beta-ketoacyl-[acyl-carrier-protein] synthase family protein, partial [Desulfobacula sp.]